MQETRKISSDTVLMIDEMYVQKAGQYQDEYVGVKENGDLYDGILVMIVGLKKSIPYVIQAIPEVKFIGKLSFGIAIVNGDGKTDFLIHLHMACKLV